MIDKIISHYKITEELGRGGMGVVYKAEDTRLKRTVALKFLPPGLETHKEEQARLLQEAQAAATLNHPNICTIHDISEFHDQQFIVMEYVDGQTLRQAVPVSKSQDAIDYAIQIGEALQEAHSKGVVHRDIKTDNIMVNSRNQIKVMDFGLAKLKGTLKLTKTSSTVGTLAYMAPEQIQGVEVDARSDIFSFGVVLYEMLTGHLPFNGEYESAIMYAILNEAPESIQKYRPDLSSEWLHVLYRALEKNPEDRYQSVQDILIDLKRLKRDTGKVSREKTPAEVMMKATSVETPDHKIPEKPASIRRETKNNRIFLGAFIGIVIVLIFAAAVIFWPSQKSTLIPNRVAVINFENKSGDTSLDYLQRKAAEILVVEISKLNFLETVPFTQSAELIKTMTGSQIQKELSRRTGAGLIVSGSLFKEGDQIQFQPKITDQIHDKLLVSLPVSGGALNSLDSLMDDMAQRVLSAFAWKFDPIFFSLADHSSNLSTYQVFKEFREASNFFFKADFISAINGYKKTVELDPDLFHAEFFMVIAYNNVGNIKAADSVTRKLSSWRSRMTDVERLWLLYLEYLIKGDLRERLRTSRELLKMVPSYPGQQYEIALDAYGVNRLYEARASLTTIDEKNDFVTRWEFFWSIWGDVEHLLRNFQQELEITRKWQDHFPESRSAFMAELRALIGLGKIEEVKNHIAKIYTLSGGNNPGRSLLTLAWELKVHGYETEAAEFTKQAFEWYRNRPTEELNTIDMKWQLFDLLYFSSFRIKEDLSPVSQMDASKTIVLGSSRNERIGILEQIAEDLISREPENIYWRWRYGMLMATLGKREQALEIYDWLGSMQQEYLYGTNIAYQAVIAAHLGEKDHAMVLLQDAFHRGYKFGIHYHSDPRWEPLRDYPAFLKFIEPQD